MFVLKTEGAEGCLSFWVSWRALCPYWVPLLSPTPRHSPMPTWRP